MIYQFSNCSLDLIRHELICDGKIIHVEPQVFDILVLFVENAGHLITRDHLIEAVWQGLSVSDSTISARMNAARKSIGDNGKDQRIIKTVPRRGFQFAVDVTTQHGRAAAPQPNTAPNRQDIRFVVSSDGVKIAYARSGNGPGLIRVGHWLSHLELDWQSPIWQPFLETLGRAHTLYRYDQRGTGLSSHEFKGFDIDEFVDDLEAVADASQLETFPLIAASQAVPVAIKYAAKFPERVSKLILYGGYAEGRFHRQTSPGDADEQTVLSLIRAGWGQPEHTFAKAFTSLFMPDATADQIDNITRLQRASTSPENAVKLRQLIDRFMVRDLLPGIKTPTLVVHSCGDVIHPLDQARILASEIPNAQFVMLDSNNHIPVPQDPAWTVMMQEIEQFLNDDTGPAPVPETHT